MLSEPSPNESGNTLSSRSDRRECYRAKIGASQLRVRIWKIAPGTSLNIVPKPSQELFATVCNIGLGGLGISGLRGRGDTVVRMTDRLRIEISFGTVSVLVEGKLREPPPQDGALTGIRFAGNKSNYAYHKARSTLSTIMGLVQREGLVARAASGT